MKNMTLYLSGFHLASLRRKPQSAQQVLAKKLADLKQKTFSQLSECFGQFIPKHCLRPSEPGSLSRQRLFSKENTFWAFLSQVVDADGGCQEASPLTKLLASKLRHINAQRKLLSLSRNLSTLPVENLPARVSYQFPLLRPGKK